MLNTILLHSENGTIRFPKSEQKFEKLYKTDGIKILKLHKKNFAGICKTVQSNVLINYLGL